MKWLIIQSDGEHKGQDAWQPNWFMRECYSLQDALFKNHQEADIWGLRHKNFDKTPDFESYDVVLLVENYELGWLPDFSRMHRPLKLQWIIDLHCQPWEKYAPFTVSMDAVLHSTYPLIEGYNRCFQAQKHVWFPNAFDDRYFWLHNYSAAWDDRPVDAIYIGGLGPKRQNLVGRLVLEAGLKHSYGITGLAYVEALQKAKIGFNMNIGCDINYRTFETIGSGACLLTEHDVNLSELGFENMYNCVLYYDADDAVAKAKDLLKNDRWKTIGRNGYLLARRHTYEQRIKKLLTQL